MSAAVMTAEQATTFDHHSDFNSQVVENSLECGCKPYVDVFTYRRWQAQGFYVRRGQKSIRITTYREIEKDNGEKISVPRTSYVFCRCQVNPKGS